MTKSFNIYYHIIETEEIVYFIYKHFQIIVFLHFYFFISKFSLNSAIYVYFYIKKKIFFFLFNLFHQKMPRNQILVILQDLHMHIGVVLKKSEDWLFRLAAVNLY